MYDEIKEWYKESLVAKIEALNSALNYIKEDFEQGVNSIKRIAHSLRGSGGTYGFPIVSKIAGQLEEVSNESIESKTNELINLLNSIISEDSSKDKTGLLIIDDDHDICFLIQKKLESKNREIYIANTAEEAYEILEAKTISLIILDLMLPDMDGRNFIISLNEKSRTSNIPIFILSAKTNSQIKTECFALGVDQFFIKPFDPDTFAAAVASKLHGSGTIHHDLVKDPLTNILNRAAFLEAYDRAHAYSQRSKEPLSLGILDLDHFKSINDTYGHAVGDQVLVDFTKTVSMNLRKSDIFARWGGEEFVLLLPNTPLASAKKVIQNILEKISLINFKSSDNNTFNITFSAGVTNTVPDQPFKITFSTADNYLYHAKKNGRSKVFTSDDKIVLKAIKILIAEDDKFISRLLKYNLEKLGFEVMVYDDGLSALKASKKNDFNLFILDVNMPKMNGYQLLENLRAIPKYKKIPIVISSALGQRSDIVKGISLGATDYILKPFNPQHFISRIQKLLRDFN